MREHQEYGFRPERRSKFNWGILAAATVLAFCFAAGYILSELLFRFVGNPSELWSYVISGLLSLVVFVFGMKLMIYIGTRRLHRKGVFDKARGSLMYDVIGAMEQISSGDFSVLLPVNEHDPFAEIAESINKMAKELGSMENLRQDFISNVSHELQSPLTSISGFAELLRNGSITQQQRSHYIDVIETEAKRLSKLSENLLRLSSLDANAQPLTLTVFSLDKQIQNAVLMLEPQWSANELEISVELEKVSVEGDEGLLSQIWVNLLHNAIKFTPKGGKIDIALTSSEAVAVCRISDSGIGLSEEDRMHIFERFYKADKSRDRASGGSGLGLSIVKKIVELHGGTITVQSKLDAGSTFTVKIPLQKK